MSARARGRQGGTIELDLSGFSESDLGQSGKLVLRYFSSANKLKGLSLPFAWSEDVNNAPGGLESLRAAAFGTA